MANWVTWCILGEIFSKIIACVGGQIRHNRASISSLLQRSSSCQEKPPYPTSRDRRKDRDQKMMRIYRIDSTIY